MNKILFSFSIPNHSNKIVTVYITFYQEFNSEKMTHW